MRTRIGIVLFTTLSFTLTVAGQTVPGRAVSTAPQRLKIAPLKLTPVHTLVHVPNTAVAQNQAGIITLLEKQRQAADLEAAHIVQTKVHTAGLQSGPSRTMSAGSFGARTSLPGTAAATANSPTTANANRPTLGRLSPGVLGPAVTCASDPAYRILQVSGSTSPATFTQDDRYNFYTITGCSFGDPGPNSKVYIYFKDSFHQDFQIQEWTDNGIKINLDRNLRGVMDQDNLTLVVQRADGKQTSRNGFKFFAARETTVLSRFPQSGFSLNKFTPTQTSDLKVQYSSPSSPRVAPNISGYTSGVSWECSDCFANIQHPNFSKFTQAGEDIYSFKGLQPGFVPSDASMAFSDIVCESGAVHREGQFALRWVGDDLHAQWQGQTCVPSGCGGFGQPDCFVSPPGSNYALNIWVTGPRGVDPWTGKPK
jgi:hypothetical protein